MPEPLPHPTLVPFDSSFQVATAPTRPPPGAPGKKGCRKRRDELLDRLRELQRRLYAENRRALLLVFQAMDAAGKDSTIRSVMSGVNPAGCQVFAFKRPSAEELDHDFLWRTSRRLPERGRIGIFNRSHYEEVLVVRVHPAYLDAQHLPRDADREGIWERRFASIRAHEEHLAQNGTTILKFWLNVSREEQRRRFLRRLDEPDKNWKFSAGDVAERAHWDAYMHAYQEALNATSRPCAPWFAIPADDKPWMRLQVAEIVVGTLERMDPRYPHAAAEQEARFAEMRRVLETESPA